MKHISCSVYSGSKTPKEDYYTLGMGTQAPSLELLHENGQVSQCGNFNTGILFGMVTTSNKKY